MKVYVITDFSEGSHWDTALIEAESEQAARMILKEAIVYDSEEDYPEGRPDEVYAVQPESNWHVRERERPLVFVLGRGCR